MKSPAYGGGDARRTGSEETLHPLRVCRDGTPWCLPSESVTVARPTPPVYLSSTVRCIVETT